MSGLPPTNEELPTIKTALEHEGADVAKAMPKAIEDYVEGAFTIDRVQAYAIALKAKHPELWPLSPEEAEQRETDDKVRGLIADILSNPRSPNARGALVRATGKAKADELMRENGFKSIGDFVSKPRKPESDKSDDKPSDAKNPWSRAGWSITKQGQMTRKIGVENAQKMAAKVGSFIGATRPAQ